MGHSAQAVEFSYLNVKGVRSVGQDPAGRLALVLGGLELGRHRRRRVGEVGQAAVDAERHKDDYYQEGADRPKSVVNRKIQEIHVLDKWPRWQFNVLSKSRAIF